MLTIFIWYIWYINLLSFNAYSGKNDYNPIVNTHTTRQSNRYILQNNNSQRMVDTYLVFTIIFNNENTFNDLSREQCKLLLDTSCSMSMKNPNVLQAMMQFQIEYNQSMAKVCYEMLHSNIVSLVFAKSRKELDKISLYSTTEADIIMSANKNDIILDNFKKLLVAEYKQQVYDNTHDPYFDQIEHAIMNETKRIIIKNYGKEYLKNYRHNH